jgi:hypothetical protein
MLVGTYYGGGGGRLCGNFCGSLLPTRKVELGNCLQKIKARRRIKMPTTLSDHLVSYGWASGTRVSQEYSIKSEPLVYLGYGFICLSSQTRSRYMPRSPCPCIIPMEGWLLDDHMIHLFILLGRLYRIEGWVLIPVEWIHYIRVYPVVQHLNLVHNEAWLWHVVDKDKWDQAEALN